MPLRLRIRNWKIRLISWIKKSDYYYPAKSNLIQQVEKYSSAIPNYERAKELHQKQKASPLTIKEKKELTKRLRKFDRYEAHELDENHYGATRNFY